MKEQRILDLVRKSFLRGETVDAETSLFQSGRLDSMSMLTLLSVVEDLFDASILNDGFDIRRVDTVRQIAAAVAGREVSRTRENERPVKGSLVP